jgi:hypothetical protein
MAAKFSICFATTARTPEQRRELLSVLAIAASGVLSRPVWILRVREHEVFQGAWDDEPIDIPDGWVVALYPKVRSSTDGAWLVERDGQAEVWTLSVPMPKMNASPDEVLKTLWNLGSISRPCIAGEEYSMVAALRFTGDVLSEAQTDRSLATHAVVGSEATLAGWSVLRTEGGRVLLARVGKSSE